MSTYSYLLARATLASSSCRERGYLRAKASGNEYRKQTSIHVVVVGILAVSVIERWIDGMGEVVVRGDNMKPHRTKVQDICAAPGLFNVLHATMCSHPSEAAGSIEFMVQDHAPIVLLA